MFKKRLLKKIDGIIIHFALLENLSLFRHALRNFLNGVKVITITSYPPSLKQLIKELALLEAPSLYEGSSPGTIYNTRFILSKFILLS